MRFSLAARINFYLLSCVAFSANGARVGGHIYMRMWIRTFVLTARHIAWACMHDLVFEAGTATKGAGPDTTRLRLKLLSIAGANCKFDKLSKVWALSLLRASQAKYPVCAS